MIDEQELCSVDYVFFLGFSHNRIDTRPLLSNMDLKDSKKAVDNIQ